MRAFVTGGSGYVGRNLIGYLAEHGHQVVALSRSDTSDATILAACKDVTIVRGDVGTRDDMQAGMLGCNAVFHLAARVETWGPWPLFMQTTVQGTRNAVECARAAGVTVFVHVSTESVLTKHQLGGMSNMDETMPLDPPVWAKYSRSTALAEKEVLAAHNTGDNFKVVIVRPRFVWGKDDTVLLPKLCTAAASGQLRWFTPPYKTSTCHVTNLCEGLLLAAEKGRSGEVYFITDGAPHGFKEFVTRYLATQGVIPPTGTLPAWLAFWLAGLLESIPFTGWGETQELQLCRQTVALMAQETTVVDAKARRELGYVGKVGYEEGMAGVIKLDRH